MFASTSAIADPTKDQCIDANGRAQVLRREGKLTAVREMLQQCIHPACPALIRDDCAKRFEELESAQPTIAFEVKDAAGSDESAVKVTVDGKPLAARLDGMALPVDIGEQVFVFEVAGQRPVMRKFVVTEGEKGRRERVVIGEAPSSTAASAPPAVAVAGINGPVAASPVSSANEPGSARGTIGTQKVLGLVAGALGVAGVGLGSVFGLLTLSQKSQQEHDCGSSASCTASGHAKALDDHSLALTYGTVSTVGFVAGGAFTIGALLLFMTGHAAHAPANGRLFFVPSVAPGGGGASLTGRF